MYKQKVSDDEFEYQEEGFTIGKLKDPRKTTRKWKRIGGFNVGLLKKFLKKLPNGSDICIGIYVNRETKSDRIEAGFLSNMHCKGYCLAPVLTHGKYKEQSNC